MALHVAESEIASCTGLQLLYISQWRVSASEQMLLPSTKNSVM